MMSLRPLYFKYGDSNFSIHNSRDHKGHVFIKVDNDEMIGWVGYRGLIPGLGMTELSICKYKIIGVDEI